VPPVPPTFPSHRSASIDLSKDRLATMDRPLTERTTRQSRLRVKWPRTSGRRRSNRHLPVRQPKPRQNGASHSRHDDNSVHLTVWGTRPLFYKVPVTQHLSDCVATGQFPTQKTVVTRCGPPAPPEAHEDMKSPDYRRIALRYYEAFRDLAEDCWAPFLADCT